MIRPFTPSRWRAPRGRVGFTLIELMVVAAFVVILAAIAVPRIQSSVDRGYDATIKSDLRNAMAAEEAYYSENRVYVAFMAHDATWIDPPGFSPSEDAEIEASLVTGGGVMIVGRHPHARSAWCLSHASGDILAGESC
jgi:Tfp pilus assembly protein PilE